MRLRTKIFLLASLLVIVITSSSFYLLNNRFSKTISNTLREHFSEARYIFEQIVAYRESELVLRTKVIADLPRIKAAISTRDVTTIITELDKLPEFDRETDLYVVADNRNRVITYKLLNEPQMTENLTSQLELYISHMKNLTDIWEIGTNIYQIAAQQIYVDISPGQETIGFFVLLGDKLDDSIAYELKNMTHTDINIGGATLYASTYDNADERNDVLQAIRRYQRDLESISFTEIDTSITRLRFGEIDNVIQFGIIEGQTLTGYILSRPSEQEFLILSQLRNAIIFLAVVSILVVFIISFFVSRRLTNPLAYFVKQTHTIAAGNLDDIIPEFTITGKDEINSLKNSFNKMLHEIQLREKRESEFKHNQAQRLEELSVLSDIATAINVNQDLDIILELILKKIILITKILHGSIFLFNKDDIITKHISLGFKQDINLHPFYESASSYLRKEKNNIFLTLDTNSEIADYFAKLELSKVLCIPFIVKDRVSGALCLYLKKTHPPLSDEQLRVLNIVAENFVRVIENARLYQTEREKEQMQHELDLAKNVQKHLLSTGDLIIPGFEIATHNTPSRDVSGDYFDVIKLDDKRIAVSIADVSGKGISAALLMANLQAAVRTLIRERCSLEELVFKINNLIYDNTEVSEYITFFIAILDITVGEIEYINAGHNPPLIFHRDGEYEKKYRISKNRGTHTRLHK
ncbi:SpoIIE family protein phosphatase [candidate division KSB1 bacterium]